jgi:UDP-N-acetylmuramoylalanine--D-glutamate ligase
MALDQNALDQSALPEVWVLELSSFQLDMPAGFEPTAATVLNLTQDHLDWHGSMEAYARAKANIFGSGLMVLNREDPLVMQCEAPPGRPKAREPPRGAENHAQRGTWGSPKIQGRSEPSCSDPLSARW